MAEFRTNIPESAPCPRRSWPPWALLSLLMPAFLLLPAARAQPEDNLHHGPEVLIVHSYHEGLSWTDGIDRGIRAALRDLRLEQIAVEYLDAKRLLIHEKEEAFVRKLESKYLVRQPRVVIVSDNDALWLISRNRERLFADVPIVFCGINDFDESLLDHPPAYTGIVEETDAPGTLTLIRSLQPGLKRLIVIADATSTGKAEIAKVQRLQKENQAFAGLELEIHEGSTRVELRKILAGTDPATDAVLLSIFTRDGDGQAVGFEESAWLISSLSTAPTYGLFVAHVGHGVIGGVVTTPFDQGFSAGTKAGQLLAGTPLGDLPIERNNPFQGFLDPHAAQRFGLSIPEHLPGIKQIISDDPTQRAAGINRTIRMGVLTNRGSDTAIDRWQPTADYLSRSIPGYEFQVIPMDFDEVCDLADAASVDVMLINPLQYASLEMRTESVALATIRHRTGIDRTAVASSVVVVRADRDDLNALSDLAWKHVAIVSQNSLGGWILAKHEMVYGKHRVDPASLKLIESGSHDQVALSVVHGHADAGVLRADVLQQLIESRTIEPGRLRILHEKPPDGAYPYPHSTALFPDMPMVCLPHVPAPLAELIAKALWQMEEFDPASIAAGHAGWSTPLNYQPVHRIMRDLRHGPYADVGAVGLRETLRRYWLVLTFLAAFSLCGLALTLIVWSYNRRLRQEGRLTRQSVARLEATLESIDDGVLTLNDHGCILDMNQAASEMTGCWLEDALGRPIHDVVRLACPLDHPTQKAPAASSSACSDWLCTEDGLLINHRQRQMNVSIRCRAVDHGQVESGAFVLVIHDQTARIARERELENHQTLIEAERTALQTIFNTAQVGLILLDHQGRVVRTNQAVQGLTHRPISEMIGKTPGCGLGCEHADPISQGWSETPACQACSMRKLIGDLRDGRQTSGHEDVPIDMRINGISQKRHYSIQASTIKLHGAPHILLSAFDITELKRTEQRLEKATQAAEAANRAKSDFLANMSHEIRTPMTAILGFTDVLIDLASELPTFQEPLNTIQRNGRHLTALINDILDISRIEAGRLETENKPVTLVKLVGEIMSLMRVRAETKNIRLECELRKPMPQTIQTDAVRLRQILINLLGNAIKFTEEGGVRLIVGLTDIDSPKSTMRFEIVDTGMGIQPHILPTLFNPFTQADTGVTRKYGGSGLGLAISKRLSHLLGGDITATSTPGSGSSFVVSIDAGTINRQELDHDPADSLSLKSQATNPQSEAPEDSPTLRSGLRILLAEDGPDNQRLISFLLRKAGAQVTIVENGRLALEALAHADAQQQPFDLVLMDMQMPEMDGYSATRAMRQAEDSTPVIALTAHAMAEDRARCLDAGCDEYDTKPVNLRNLIQKINRLVDSDDSGLWQRSEAA